MNAKAASVLPSGEPDGFVSPRGFRAEVFPDGHTRLVVSVPPHELQATHLAFLGKLGPRLGLRYVQLTDRKTGQLPTPVGRVAMELPAERVVAALCARRELVYEDGRHQIWARGVLGESVVLDENGLIFASPDDPSFRDLLASLALPEHRLPTLETRDYVRVNFHAVADAQEQSLWNELNMLQWR